MCSWARTMRNERRTRIVIALCGTMMVVEIVGGMLFRSMALVADGLHVSTHAAALLTAAMAYAFARRRANDRRFTFGTGKFGDLAGFTGAIVLAMIALLIAWESAARLFHPVPIAFNEAIPIALGLGVNLLSAWLLRDEHHHDDHDDDHDHEYSRDLNLRRHMCMSWPMRRFQSSLSPA
jgi:cation diffusion facilitator family transporter